MDLTAQQRPVYINFLQRQQESYDNFRAANLIGPGEQLSFYQWCAWAEVYASERAGAGEQEATELRAALARIYNAAGRMFADEKTESLARPRR